MKPTVLFLNFCVFLVTVSCDMEAKVFHLQTTPDRSQFFQYEDVSLSCKGSPGAALLKRNTTRGGVESCPSGWGTLENSTCSIRTMYPFDSGLYWCESDSGERSQTLHIIVSAGDVILESPVHPVGEGDNVTLRCREKTPSSGLKKFSKDGLLVWSNITETLTIHGVSKSDEGLYMCSIPGVSQSPGSWLSVTVSEPAAAPVFPALRVIRHAVAGFPYLLSTVILALVYRDKRSAAQDVSEDRSHRVVMEVV
nr:low affinity immunoglobulin gamma Fc region receptor II-a-like [Labrus bergylta]